MLSLAEGGNPFTYSPFRRKIALIFPLLKPLASIHPVNCTVTCSGRERRRRFHNVATRYHHGMVCYTGSLTRL